MVRIRLRRVGRKKQPSYRIIVTDKRNKRDGRYIEIIGFYNPRTQPATMILQEDRALHWLSVGAQPSEAVERIMNKVGTLARYERLKAGEDLAVLVAEAEAAVAEHEDVSPKTEYAPMSKEAKAALKASRAAATAAEAPVAAAVAEAVAEESVEEPAEEEAEAEASVEEPAEEEAEESVEEPAEEEAEEDSDDE